MRAVSYTGEDLSSNIKVEHNVDILKQGNYEIKYTVEDQGLIKQSILPVEVVSSFTYASDLDWISATTDWKTVNKDMANSSTNKIKLQIHGSAKEFDKGIGTCGNSEVIYDLEGKGMNYFSAHIGLDSNYALAKASVVFKVMADGEEIYDSGVIKAGSDAKFINLPIEGVKELKLVTTDSGDGITGDYASWGDAKFTTNSSMPTLNAEDRGVKLGETVDFMEGVTATDVEDGDLTDQVEVSGTVDFNQPGNYTLTYKVVDSDDNETIKTCNIAVVDMNDFNYLSDYDWASTDGFGRIRKDEAPSGNIIRLTDEDGQEVQFEKGLGTHARRVVKYDLTDKDAAFFSSYVGVDRAMYGTVGSVAFEVWLDGEKVAETGVIGSTDAMEYLEVNIAGAKELMLVATDGGNGNGSDHAVWGDAKLHYANENNIKVNTETLRNLIEEVSQLNEKDYTVESWEALGAVKGEALALLENSFTQEQVDVMVERLTEAKENLVKLGNNAELEALIARANELEIHLYTAESSKTLQVKLKAAQDVLNVENPEQEVIDAAKEELEAAIDQLELSKGKAELYKLLQIANQMEENNYTKEADWEMFVEWTAYYNQLYRDVTTHDEEKYELIIEIYSTMIAEIESHRIDKSEVNEVNRVELEKLIARASELEIHLYTAESSKTLQAKLKAAQDVLNIEKPEQEVIDAAKEELEVAIDQLELSKGKAELYKLLQIANQMEENNYTKEADWAFFVESTAYYNQLYMDVTTHDEEKYELIIEVYSTMIAEIESHRIDKSEVNESEVSEPEADKPEANESEVTE